MAPKKQEDVVLPADDFAIPDEDFEPASAPAADAPYRQGPWTNRPRNRQEALAAIQKYNPDFFQEIQRAPQEYPDDTVINYGAAYKQQNLANELAEHFGYSKENAPPLEELVLRHRGQLLGFDPMNLPQDPGQLESFGTAFKRGLTVLTPWFTEEATPEAEELRKAAQLQESKSPESESIFRRAMSNLGAAYTQNAPTADSSIEYLDLLKTYNPELYKRVVEGDASLTRDELENGVNDAYRRQYAAMELYNKGTVYGGELLGGLGLRAGLSKAFGARATQPLVKVERPLAGPVLKTLTQPEGILSGIEGAARGETPSEKLTQGLTGFLSGTVGAPTGQYLGTKTGRPRLQGGLTEAGVPFLRTPMRGVADYLEKTGAETDVGKLMQQFAVPRMAEKAEAMLTSKALTAVRKEQDDILAQIKKLEDEAVKTQEGRIKFSEAQRKRYEKLQNDKTKVEQKLRLEEEKLAQQQAEQQLKVSLAREAEKKGQSEAYAAGLGRFPKQKKAYSNDLNFELEKLKAELEGIERRRQGIEGNVAREQLTRISLTADSTLAQIQKDVQAGNISPAEANNLLRQVEKSVEINTGKTIDVLKEAALAEQQGKTRPLLVSEQRVAPDKEVLEKRIAELEQRKAAQTAGGTGGAGGTLDEGPLPPEFNKETFAEWLRQDLANREKAGLVGLESKVPDLTRQKYEGIQQQPAEQMPPVIRALREQRGTLEKQLAETPVPSTAALVPSEELVRRTARQGAPAPMSEADVQRRIKELLSTPETRQTFLQQTPEAQALLRPYSEWTKEDISKAAGKYLYGGESSSVPETSAGMSVGLGSSRFYPPKTRTTATSAPLSEFEQYAKRAQARDLAEYNLNMPVAVPLAQTAVSKYINTLLTPATESEEFQDVLQEYVPGYEEQQKLDEKKKKSDFIKYLEQNP